VKGETINRSSCPFPVTVKKAVKHEGVKREKNREGVKREDVKGEIEQQSRRAAEQ